MFKGHFSFFSVVAATAGLFFSMYKFGETKGMHKVIIQHRLKVSENDKKKDD